MLRSIKQFLGEKLGASDGDIGHMKDFYFDDQTWAARYVVADTGNWLPGRQVLISPYAFGGLRQTEKVLRVNLTRKQIEGSPAIESHQPVSRQYEEEYHRYYGWPDYWQGGGVWGMSGFPILPVPPKTPPGKSASGIDLQPKRADAHLRSVQTVIGYHIKTSDGIVGHVCDFMMDDESWVIQQLVVKTGHRFAVLLLPAIDRYHICRDSVSLRQKFISVNPCSSAARFLWGVHPIVRRVRRGHFQRDAM